MSDEKNCKTFFIDPEKYLKSKPPPSIEDNAKLPVVLRYASHAQFLLVVEDFLLQLDMVFGIRTPFIQIIIPIFIQIMIPTRLGSSVSNSTKTKSFASIGLVW